MTITADSNDNGIGNSLNRSYDDRNQSNNGMYGGTESSKHTDRITRSTHSSASNRSQNLNMTAGSISGGDDDIIVLNGSSNPAQEQHLQQDPQQQRSSVNTSRTSTTNNAVRRRKKQYAVSTRWEREVEENGPIKDFHRFFCCCARRLGNMFILWDRADGSPVVIAGPCWPFCVFVTLPLVLGIAGAVAYFVIISNDSPLPIWVAYIYFPVLGFVLASLFCVSCQDPGLMERVTDEEAGEGGWFWNEQVGSFRPPGALYCRECGVLIQDYDHLCPWTGTGIGRRNMLAFKLFVVSVNVLCYFSIILVIVALLKGLRA